MKLQEYLRGANGFDSMPGIKTKRHRRYPNLVLFKYDIDANFSDPIIRECRGVVLDQDDDWNVVARAFDKFFNYGDFYAAEIDWSTARVQEKLDGSICTMYHYDDEWHVATSGTPDASGAVHAEACDFASYFWKTFLDQGGRIPEPSDVCYVFEAMGPANRIVVVHDKPRVRLLAVRNRATGEQFLPDDQWTNLVGIEAVGSFPLTSFADIATSFDTMSPVSQEGYVVVDATFNRVKVKHPGYVALHHAKDGMNERAFVQIARTGEMSEVLGAFPEFAPMIDAARGRYDALVKSVNATYSEIRGITEQKAFAMEAIKTPYSAALFQLRRGKDATEFFREVSVDKLMEWMQ